MFVIKNLHATIKETPILKGVNLSIGPGEIHVIMGPNGAGKSTLAKVVAGHPAYTVREGEVWLHEQNLLSLSPEARSKAGLFVSFQHPPEVPGVTNSHFLTRALLARKNPPLSKAALTALLREKMELLQLDENYTQRPINEGFSGGEKKRNEIFHMAVLQPTLAILDEIDSGLDVDAIRTLSHALRQLVTPERSLLIITHYQRLLTHLTPDYVHLFSGGTIIRSGNSQLAEVVDREGYEHA